MTPVVRRAAGVGSRLHWVGRRHGFETSWRVEDSRSARLTQQPADCSVAGATRPYLHQGALHSTPTEASRGAMRTRAEILATIS